MGAKSWLDRVFRGEAVTDAAYSAQETEPEEEENAMDGTYARPAQAVSRRDNLVEFTRARSSAASETAVVRDADFSLRDTGSHTREFKDGAAGGGGFSGFGGAAGKKTSETADAYVVFKRLKDFQMASQVADRMTESKIVILNLESCDDEIARRVLDFIGGVAYACGSMVKRIAGRVFMITPKGVNSDGEFFDEAKETAAAIRYDD